MKEIDRLARLIVLFACIEALLTIGLVLLPQRTEVIRSLRITALLLILLPILFLVVVSLRSARSQVLQEWGHPIQSIAAGRELSEDWRWTIDHVARVLELARWRTEISSVIEGEAGHLEVVLQPIFDLDSGRAIGAEALSRFSSELLQGPAEWFAAAHEVGLGVELEMAAFGRALESMSAIPPDTFLCINISPVSFLALDPTLAPLKGVEGSRLVLELTEHALIEDDQYPEMRARVEVLRTAGLRVAVDDTGTGYASLLHVVELTPDFIKLDRTLVRGIGDNRARSALAFSLVGFAEQIGAVVIAEGIESGADLRMIRNAGIALGQGYGLAMPAPPPISSSFELDDGQP